MNGIFKEHFQRAFKWVPTWLYLDTPLGYLSSNIYSGCGCGTTPHIKKLWLCGSHDHTKTLCGLEQNWRKWCLLFDHFNSIYEPKLLLETLALVEECRNSYIMCIAIFLEKSMIEFVCHSSIILINTFISRWYIQYSIT